MNRRDMYNQMDSDSQSIDQKVLDAAEDGYALGMEAFQSDGDMEDIVIGYVLAYLKPKGDVDTTSVDLARRAAQTIISQKGAQ